MTKRSEKVNQHAVADAENINNPFYVASPKSKRANHIINTGKGLEQYAALIFQVKNYDKVRIKGGVNDKGADLELYRNDYLKAIVQCKQYKASVVTELDIHD